MKNKIYIPSNIVKERVQIGKSDFENPVYIGYGTDDNYVMPMGVSMISVLENNPSLNFVFYILSENLSKENISKLKIITEHYPNCCLLLCFLDMKILKGLPIFSSLGKAAYIRIFLEQAAFENVDKILYLDGDIVCLKSIECLLKKNFNDKTIMAVEDVPDTAKKQEEKFNVQHYFNSGMLYINMNKWKEKKITEKFLEVCFAYKEKLNHLDQDALNIILNEEKIIVDNCYNYISQDINEMDVPQNTVFLHYAGTKPWYCWLQFSLKKYFEKYYKLSPWKNQSLDEPRNYREMHYMSRYYKRQHEFANSFYWLCRYLYTKFKFKLN